MAASVGRFHWPLFMTKHQKRILFITDTRPASAVSGSDQRSNILFRALQGVGIVETLFLERYSRLLPEEIEACKVKFGLVGLMPVLPPGSMWPWKAVRWLFPRLVDRVARAAGSRALRYEPDPRISAWLAQRLESHHYDAIIGRYLPATAVAGTLAYQPLLIDIDDLDTQVARANLATAGFSPLRQILFRRHLRTVSRVVQLCCTRCEHLWVAAENDRHEVGYERSSLLPNIPFNAPCASEIVPSSRDRSSQTVLIVASLFYRPNVEGIDQFITRIWPYVHKIHPRASLRIVGSHMQAEDRIRWGRVPGVRVVGFVEDLRNEYARCAFTVCPVFIGGGSKIKVLESLANGRTAVISEHSHRGYENVLRHLEALWVAEDDDQFILGCIRLLEEADLRDKLAKQGHFLVSEKFSFQRAQAAVSQALEDVFKRFPEGVQKRR